MYHIRKAKELSGADAIVAVMSGCFTQRGETAVYDKWTRARMALSAGADAVVELPVSFACAGAERFANGGVDIAAALGSDFLAFGSETADLSALTSAAELLANEPEEYKAELKSALAEGITFAAARERAIERISPAAAEVLRTPNSILGTEYIKAIIKGGYNIKPVAVKRMGSAHDSDEAAEHPSALSLRKMLAEGKTISIPFPAEAAPLFWETAFPAVRTALVTLGREGIAALADVSEGMEALIMDSAKTARSMDELIDGAKTRRYTRARIARTLAHALLGITKEKISEIDACGAYIRVLGARPASGILGEISRRASVPVITSVADAQMNAALSLDIKATDIYSALSGAPLSRDYTTPFIKL